MTYGTGTRSYNRSAEKRQADQERAAATAAWKPGQTVMVPTGCPCCHRARCVWGEYLWASAPDWMKRRHLSSDQITEAERATAEATKRKEQAKAGTPIARRPRVNFLESTNQQSFATLEKED